MTDGDVMTAWIYVNTSLPGKRVLIEVGFRGGERDELVRLITAEVRLSHQHTNDRKDVYVSGDYIGYEMLEDLADLVRESTDGIVSRDKHMNDLSAGDFVERVSWSVGATEARVFYLDTEAGRGNKKYSLTDGTWRDLQYDIDEAVAKVFQQE